MLPIDQLKAEVEKLNSNHISLRQIERLETQLSKIKQSLESSNPSTTESFKDFNAQQEQTLLEKIIENNPYAIGIADAQGRIQKVNKAFFDLFTTIPSEDYSIFTDPLLQSSFCKELDKAKSGQTAYIPELWYNSSLFSNEFPSKDFCVRTSIFPIKDDNDEVTNYILIHQDITEIKNTEKTLREREKKYRLIFENIQNVYYECTLEGIITEVSPSGEILSGYTRDELIGKNLSEIYADYNQRKSILEILFKEGSIKNYTVDLLNKNGEIRKCLASSQLIFNESGIPVSVNGSTIDITERHRMEEKLRLSEEKYRDLFEKANDLICTLDFEGNITSVNPVAEKKLGLKLNAKKACHISKYVTPDSYKVIKENILQKLEYLENNSSYEVEAIAKDGRHYFFEVSSFLRYNIGKPSEIFAISRDITDRKKAEKELDNTRERYQELFQSTSDIVYTMDFKGNFTSVNPVVEKILGYKFEELTNPNMADYISPATNKLAAEFIRKKLKGEAENTTYEVEFIKKDGTYTSFEINSFLRYVDGKPTEVFGIARDISERKRLSEILKRSEEKYRMIFENAPLGIMIADKDGNIIEINPALLEMLGSESDLETKKINILEFAPLVKSGVAENFRRCMQKGESLSSEHEYTSLWGKLMYSRVYTKPIWTSDGNLQGFQAIIEDITEEKEAAKLLTNSVQEKEALLREIHHRVKNNLQIIISLINMQVSEIDDPQFRQKFLELQQRVRTMSIIHEDLYMSKDLAKVNFGNYVQRLTVNLNQIYQCSKHINLHFSFSDEITLEIDTAIPLGIIVNELVSNSFKHAFPENRVNGTKKTKHSIDIEFTETNEEFLLTIADNGIGFNKKEFGENEETLGLSLVDILISQLRGSFKFHNNKGARYEICIPKKQSN
jgi:PAS domain S-box-containing protein